jgi:hypothetical protein
MWIRWIRICNTGTGTYTADYGGTAAAYNHLGSFLKPNIQEYLVLVMLVGRLPAYNHIEDQFKGLTTCSE